MLCPVARAARRTRRASPAGSFTVKTSLRPGTSIAPSSRPLHVAARLALGEAVTTGKVARRLDYVHPGGNSSVAVLTRLATWSARARRPSVMTLIYYLLRHSGWWTVDEAC